MPLPQLSNPRTARRLAGAVLLLGGILAGLGTLLRARVEAGNDQWTYLLDTGGLLVALAGAGLDFRVSGRFGMFDERAGYRRALIQAGGGSLAAVCACITLGWVATGSWPAIAKGVISVLLTSGIGVGLAGMLYIGWFSGGDYLERRIGQRSDEEW